MSDARRLRLRPVLPLQGKALADQNVADVAPLSRHPRQRAAVPVPAVPCHVNPSWSQQGREPLLCPQALHKLVLAMRTARFRRVDVEDCGCAEVVAAALEEGLSPVIVIAASRV
jgi:hypothetical protein